MKTGVSLSIGVSIVIYRTKLSEIATLLDELFEQGASHVYVIDNSPAGFDAALGWKVSEKVSYVRTGKNLGYGAGHNIAIARSAKVHRYHLVCNPDIRLGTDTLSRLVLELDRRLDVGLCMPKILNPERETQFLCKREPRPLDLILRRFLPRSWYAARRAVYEMRDCSYDHEMIVPCLSGCFMFFRSTVLLEVGGFDERFFLYMEDFDLSRRTGAIAKNLYLPAAEVIHQHSRGSYRKVRLLLVHARSAIQYFNKWGWLAC